MLWKHRCCDWIGKEGSKICRVETMPVPGSGDNDKSDRGSQENNTIQ